MKDKKFFAFISYQRQDEEYAEWFRKKLEHYRLPSSLRKKDASLPKEIRPIFRDALELTGGFLAQEIEQALEQSKFLIVVCSPRSARSPWVNKEVEYFIQSGRTQYIIPYIIDGEPFAQDESNECFPPALRALTADNELLGINMNELGRDAAAIKVVARMFGLRFDALWQRYEREQRRNRWLVVGGALLFAVVSLAIGGYIYRNNLELDRTNEALREERMKVEAEKNRAEEALASLHLANDSIEKQHVFLEQTNSELVEERDNVVRANWGMYENQSRYVAEKAIALTDADESYTARLLCLDILPHDLNNPDRPYTPEAEMALRYACEHYSGTLRGHTYDVNSATFSPDGRYIVSASSDNTLKIWDTKKWECIKTLEGHTSSVNSAAFSPDGRYIVSASLDKTIKIWDTKNWECIKTLEGHTKPVNSATFSPDGKYIVSASDDKTIKIWSTKSGECTKTLEGHAGFVKSVTYSPDGKYIVSASNDNTLKIWSTENWECIKTLEGHTYIVTSATFSPDGKYIVSASDDKTIKIWSTKSGECTKTLEGHAGFVKSVTYSPDGKYIVSASNDNTLKIWSTENWECIKTLEGHKDWVRSATFSPDGRYIVSASIDKTLKIWDTTYWVCVETIECESYVRDANFSPDGRQIAYATSSKINIIEFPPLQELIDETRERFKNRELTPEERRMYYLE